MNQGEEGEQCRMVGWGEGQHTTGASKTSGAMSSSGSVPSTCTSRVTPRGRSSRSGPKEVRTADLPDLVLKKCHHIRLGAVGPMLTLLHRCRARLLRLR